MKWVVNLIKALSEKDFRELVALMTITTTFLFMFAIVFVPFFIEMPDSSQRFADIILGYLFGSTLKDVMKHYFDVIKKEDERKIE